MARTPRLIVCVVATALGVACHEFPVVNPGDPRFQMRVSVVGPDTTFAIGQIVTFSLLSAPAWTGDTLWTSDSTDQLKPLGQGRFLVTRATWLGDSVTVLGSAGPHMAQHKIKVQVRATRFHLVPDSAYGASDTLLATALKEGLQYKLVAYDANGNRIAFGPYVDPASWPWRLISRDTTVVSVMGNALGSERNGRTWVIAILGGLRDSLIARVQQLPAKAHCNLPSTTLPVGDTISVSFDSWTDWGDFPIAWTPVITAVYGVPDTTGFDISGTPDGRLYTGSQPGTGVLAVRWRSPDDSLQGAVGLCRLTTTAGP